MDLEITANKIAQEYLNKNKDMNESIAKYASTNSLNIEQTKRLVEEANKNCYLQKFASTGEQVFDVAQYDKVKEIIRSMDKVEKVASLNFVEVNYNYDLEKVANDAGPDSFEYQQAIDRCHEAIGREMSKLASCRNAKEIEKSNKIIEKYEKIADKLLEKKAGLVTGLAEAALKGGAAIGGKTLGFVAEAPLKRGLMPLGYAQAFKSGFKGNLEPAEAFIQKTANVESSVGKEVVQYFKNMRTPALVLGSIGLGVGAAKMAGGLVSRMKTERDLNESFNTIVKANEDLKQIPNARAYFDVIARHSPSLALDPMVAPSLIRNFDAFSGVDVNTIGKLREIEAIGRKDHPSGTLMKDLISGVKGVSDFAPLLPVKDNRKPDAIMNGQPIFFKK